MMMGRCQNECPLGKGIARDGWDGNIWSDVDYCQDLHFGVMASQVHSLK